MLPFLLFQINRDPVAAQVQALRNQVEQLQAELLFSRGDGIGPFEELQVNRYSIVRVPC